MAVKIKDFITRDTGLLMQTFNTTPRPEGMLQNQRLLLEVLCDIRKELLELLFRTDWLKEATPPKRRKIEVETTPFTEPLSRREEKALPFEDRVKTISNRAARKKASTDEDVDAF